MAVKGGGPEGDRRRRSPSAASFDGLTQRDAEALADPTRHRVFDELRLAGRPLTVAELTEAVGVHHTAVRQHLAKLRDAGLIDEDHAEPTGRGRPKLLYRLHPGLTSSHSVAAGYQRLAALLATAVRTGRTARDVGHEAGRHLARQRLDELAARDAGDGDRTGTVLDPAEVVVAEADRLGFRPVVDHRDDGVDVVLRHCPFQDVAADDPDTVCSLHLGLAEGVAEATGGIQVHGMVVNDPYRAGCRLQLRRTAEE